jgi:23S rRNA (guanosine2251-2'-O)-methyltransferase
MFRKLKLSELNRLSIDDFKEAEKIPLVVILDDVRSMHNVGAVFRTCDAFRVAQLYLCGITPQPPHREIHKTALGAEDSVEWEAVEKIEELLLRLKTQGWEIIAVEQTENSALLTDYTSRPDKPIALILGNEVEGVSQRAIDLCDSVAEIPQYGTKHSLNISVAAGIVIYHFATGFQAT